jgi:heavy metal sensor kinase
MKFFQSIRGRLLIWYGLLLAAMLVGFGSTAWNLERASRLRQVDAELQDRMAIVTRALREYHPSEGPSPTAMNLRLSPDDRALFSGSDGRGCYYLVWLREGKPLAQSANAPQDVPRPDHDEVSVRQRGTMREAFLFTPPVDCLLVGRSVANDLAELRKFALLLTLAGTVVLALGLAGGWWLISHALRPIGEISNAAARIANGDLSQRINTSQTESELGELATLLNSTFARLDAAFTQQARFTSDAAHELRTPLSVLLTQTQASLARERCAAEYRDALVSNQATAQRMRKLTESLLELARLDAGQEPLNRMRCDLSLIASDCAEMIRPLADARHVSLALNLAPAPCEADPDHLNQVVTNLLKNAIDYNREHGEVRLTTRRENGCVLLEVSDSGIGISPEHLPHVFERFYRADASRSNGSRGTGLGLAISKAIVEAHGGSLEASSEPGQGTSFVLRLPAR